MGEMQRVRITYKNSKFLMRAKIPNPFLGTDFVPQLANCNSHNKITALQNKPGTAEVGNTLQVQNIHRGSFFLENLGFSDEFFLYNYVFLRKFFCLPVPKILGRPFGTTYTA